MHNPLQGIVPPANEHEDDGGYTDHWGRDIAPRPRVKGAPVHAPFSGWWKSIVRWSYPGNRAWTWADYVTGNGGLIANPDGEGQGFNHVLVLDKWDAGDWINAGELIGYLDDSGNQTGQHLHLETWADWRNRYSHYSPKILFDKYGIDTMDDPAPTITPASTQTKDWFDMANESSLRKIIREELDTPRPIDATGTVVYWVNPATGRQERTTLTRLLQTAFGVQVEDAELSGVTSERVAEIAAAVVPEEVTK